MPVYEYACSKCGHEFEAEQRITEEPLKTCPRCRARKLKRLISQTSFVLKGSGWYADLYASKAKPESAEAKPDAAAAKSDKAGDAKRLRGREQLGQLAPQRSQAEEEARGQARQEQGLEGRRLVRRLRRGHGRAPPPSLGFACAPSCRRRRPCACPILPRSMSQPPRHTIVVDGLGLANELRDELAKRGRAAARRRRARAVSRRRAGGRRPGQRLLHQGQAARLRAGGHDLGRARARGRSERGRGDRAGRSAEPRPGGRRHPGAAAAAQGHAAEPGSRRDRSREGRRRPAPAQRRAAPARRAVPGALHPARRSSSCWSASRSRSPARTRS